MVNEHLLKVAEQELLNSHNMLSSLFAGQAFSKTSGA